MSSRIWILAAAVGLALTACGGGSSGSTASSVGSSQSTGGASSDPSTPDPTSFVTFVTQQVPTQPAFGVAPTALSSIGTDVSLGDAQAFAGLTFGSGDAVPAGTFQAVVGCTEAGQALCNPAVSADLNSNLN